MQKITVKLVLDQLPIAIKYFFASIIFGASSCFLIFKINKKILEAILNLWSKRILLGIIFFGEKFSLSWFIANNIIALMLVIISFLLILLLPRSKGKFKFKDIERRRPKIILSALYIIPVGALVINGFFLSLFSTYVLLNFGKEKFFIALALTLPHGTIEIIALLLASSLVLAYLKILKPTILKGNLKQAVKIAKKLLASQVTLFFVVLIILLLFFSGIMEGVLVLLVK
jgi:uncharacterized membrane protein SpoIIM required for sporulation